MPASGSNAVRVLVLDGAVDPFPEPPVESRARDIGARPMFDGARQAWAFLSGAEGADPSVLAPLPVDPFAGGASIRPDDADGYDARFVVFDEDVVDAPRPRR